uniref:Putative portal protein n=1 Tax=viral metagenome TaxID=1070528 RepID=A0A6M3JC47_9ZZZZ
MAVFDNLMRRVGYVRAAAPAQAKRPPWLIATAEASHYNIPSGELWGAQAELYQRLSWIYIAVTHVADMVAKTRLTVRKRVGEDVEEIANHPFEMLMERPNPDDSKYELLVATVAYRALTGNSYWHLNRASANVPPQELYVIPTPNIVPVSEGQLIVDHYDYDPGGAVKIPLKPYEVMHCKQFHPRSPFIGMSPIEPLATVASGDMQQQKWNSNFFGKNNAKPSGILSFSNRFNDEAWEEMKEQIRSEYGGTNRSLMLLHGVGDKSVAWTQTSINHKDMDFLASRKFTKEEIFAVYAPGLAAILDPNATEANANAGERTFRNHCWSVMEALSQSITNKILPAYGPDLVAQFEDIRITDRQLELAEIAEYSRTHTVNEVRRKYYEDEGLEDDRGKLFVAEIGPGSLTLLAPPPEPELSPMPGEDLVPELAEQEPPEEPSGAIPDIEGMRKAELGKWKRYAVKRSGEKASEFNPEHLPSDVVAVIHDRLVLAQSPEEVKAAFSGPFLIKASRRDRRGLVDPNSDAKDAAERRLQRLLRERLDGQLNEVMDALGDPPDIWRLGPAFWETQTGLLLAPVRGVLESMARDSAERLMVKQAVGVSWDLVAERAADWARKYGFDLVKGITDTTAKMTGKYVARYIEEQGQTIGDLQAALTPWFGPVRAEKISVTEVTRAFAQGELDVVQAAKDAGMEMRQIFHTERDDLVCIVCEPLDNQETDEIPPLHPLCRCWLSHEWVK